MEMHKKRIEFKSIKQQLSALFTCDGEFALRLVVGKKRSDDLATNVFGLVDEDVSQS